MADFTSSGWVAGETVSVYAVGSAPPNGGVGSALATAVASSSGAAAFTGLSSSTPYVAVGGTSGRSARFSITQPLPAQSGSGGSQGVLAPAATGVAATDTANLLAAIAETVTLFGASGGTVFLRGGIYVINAKLTLPEAGGLVGAGSGGRYGGGAGWERFGTTLRTTAITSGPAVEAQLGGGQTVAGIFFDGPQSAPSSRLGGSIAIDISTSIGANIHDLFIQGYTNQIIASSSQQAVLRNIIGYSHTTHGFAAVAASGFTLRDVLLSNSGPGGGVIEAHDACDYLLDSCTGGVIDHAIWDEASGTLRIVGTSSDIEISGKTMFTPQLADHDGVVIGDGTNPVLRVKVRGFDVGLYQHHTTSGCRGIVINPGAVGTVLEDLTVHESDDGIFGWYEAGHGIVDNGTGTVYRNVNGLSSTPTSPDALVLSDFDGIPSGVAAGPVLDLADGRAYFRLPDDTIRYLSLNAPLVPANVTAPVISGTLATGQTLTCSTGTWQSYPSSYAYQWQRDTGSGYANISGATAATHVLVLADEGADGVRCRVTASNVTGAGTAANSNAVVPPASGVGFDLGDRPDVSGVVEADWNFYTLALSNNDPISSVPNSAATAAWPLENTGSSRPTFKTAILNGLSVGRLDGVDDYLEATQATARLTGNKLAVFYVGVRRADISNACLLGFGGKDPATDDAGEVSGEADFSTAGNALIGHNHEIVYRAGAAKATLASAPAVDAPFLFAARWDGTNCSAYLSGPVTDSGADSTPAFAAKRVRVGARIQLSTYTQNDIGRIVIVSGNLTTADFNFIRDGLMNEIGL